MPSIPGIEILAIMKKTFLISRILLSSCGIMLFLLPTVSCSFINKKSPPLPTMPLISVGFDQEVVNNGILPLVFRGDGNVSYTEGLDGMALDLSQSSMYRKPIILINEHRTKITDYSGISILLWTQMGQDDFNSYVILGQKDEFEDFEPFGWSISSGISGAWSWWISDGINEQNYRPLPSRQAINDGNWHLIGFSVDFSTREARLYYDGKTVAIYTLQQEDFSIFNKELYLGADPFAADPVLDTYNGKIDNLMVWSRVLTDKQVEALYLQFTEPKFKRRDVMPDSLTVMSWNTWGGGIREGRFVGVQRVVEIIRESGADIVSLQESFGTGPMLADNLGFYLYQRSEGLCVLSRFPLGQTYDIYRRRVSGAVTVELPENNKLLFCPVYLSYLPNNGPYIMSGSAHPDSIVLREMETRGAEMRYVVWELQTLVDREDNVPLILAGDFNSGSHLDWTEENKDIHYGLAIEYPTTLALQKAGFIDSYRKLHPDVKAFPGHTWSPRFREVLQDRVNFIFYNGSRLEPSWSAVIDTHPLGFPSDHGAVVSSFKWKKK